MTDDAPHPSGHEIERELVELAAALIVPPAPDLRGAVRARLAAGAPRQGLRRPGRPGRSPARWVAAAVLAVLAALALTSPGQAAVARLWQFAGVVFRQAPDGGPAAPAPSPSPDLSPHASINPSLGALPGQSVVDLASARRLASFPVSVPTALGAPDAVLVDGAGSVVSLIYGPGPGRPPAGVDGISARIDEFASSQPMFEKSVGPGTVEPVVINGAPGIWVSAPHEVVYLDRQGGFDVVPPHLAARTLIWQLGGVTVRLEGAFTRDQALGLARATP